VALTVMTLFVPCVAHLLMIVREQGARTAAWMLALVTGIALGTGAALNAALRAMDVTFR
jgi:ferrous iron transport protein B